MFVIKFANNNYFKIGDSGPYVSNIEQAKIFKRRKDAEFWINSWNDFIEHPIPNADGELVYMTGEGETNPQQLWFYGAHIVPVRLVEEAI